MSALDTHTHTHTHGPITGHSERPYIVCFQADAINFVAKGRFLIDLDCPALHPANKRLPSNVAPSGEYVWQLRSRQKFLNNHDNTQPNLSYKVNNKITFVVVVVVFVIIAFVCCV